MANIGQFMQANMLNWVFSGAAPTAATKWGIGLSTAAGVPSSVSSSQSEVATGSGYTRQSMAWGAAGTPSGSGTVTNASAITFGPFSNAQSISGLLIYDTILTLNSGNLLWMGTLATARTVGVGDSLVIAAGSILVTLA
jgi:hypothetical protein